MATESSGRGISPRKRQPAVKPTTGRVGSGIDDLSRWDARPDAPPGVARWLSVVDRLEAVAARLEGLISSSDDPLGLPRAGLRLPADIEARREAMKPPRVRVIFVTAPIFPEDSTNFYHADSHLYRCIRGAFVRTLGHNVPQGEDFLSFFRDQGCWLYHVAPEGTRGPGRPRAEWVRPTVLSLAAVLLETDPDQIVGVKAKLKPRILEAARRAGMQDRVTVVATPRMLWDAQFCARFRQMLPAQVASGNNGSEDGPDGPDLVDAILHALLDRSNKRQRARDLVRFIEAHPDWPSGRRPLRKTQVSALIRSRRDLFDVNSAGVRLQDGGDARGRRPRVIDGARS